MSEAQEQPGANIVEGLLSPPLLCPPVIAVGLICLPSFLSVRKIETRKKRRAEQSSGTRLGVQQPPRRRANESRMARLGDEWRR